MATMHVVSAIMFFPRGGSAGVTRAFARGLRLRGVEVRLLAGSRSDLGPHGDARDYYGSDVLPVSFDAALASGDPLGYEGPVGTAPLHPSYEQRDDAPDRVFATLDDADFERQVRAWALALKAAGAAEADVLHLHHLTPLHEAAARVAPEVPILTHLHGTELLMLEQIEAGPPEGWTHAETWARRLRDWAAASAGLLVAPGGRRRAADLLGLQDRQMVELPNGVDTDQFRRRHVDRRTVWRRELVTEPRGWAAGQREGSVRYGEAEMERLLRGVVLVYVGRFTAVKRLPLLIEAFGAARERAGAPASLVLIGGHPGEWEGEHPAAAIARLHAEDVFLAGWHSHAELPKLLSAADAVVTAARREQFGQLLVEGMACELPAIAPAELGPLTIIDDGDTGWLCDPDDPAALSRALEAVIRDPREAHRRGVTARRAVRERYSRRAADDALLSALLEVAGAASGQAAAA
jgi:glycosyltransferase involved in cell wall biosynthesis